MAVETPWCVLLWDGPHLYGVFGPFATREDAKAWTAEVDLRAEIVPFYPPKSEH